MLGRPAGCPSVKKKLLRCDFFGHYTYDKCQIFRNGSTHSALPIHTTLSGNDCISRSQPRQTVYLKNLFSYLIMLKLGTVVDYFK